MKTSKKEYSIKTSKTYENFEFILICLIKTSKNYENFKRSGFYENFKKL